MAENVDLVCIILLCAENIELHALKDTTSKRDEQK